MKLTDKNINQLKKTLWPLFSALVRQRGIDDEGFNNCVTCERRVEWKRGDAGHFIAGRRNWTYFHPYAVHFQCKPCNGSFRDSAPPDVNKQYKKFMVNTYGTEFTNDLIKKNRKTYQFQKPILIALIEAARKGYEPYVETYENLILHPVLHEFTGTPLTPTPNTAE